MEKNRSNLNAVNQHFERVDPSILLILNNATNLYFKKHNLPTEFQEVVSSRVLMKFHDDFNNIRKQYKGDSKYSSYCIAVLFRIIRSTVNEDVKLMNSAS